VNLSPGAKWSTAEVNRDWTTLAYILGGTGHVAGSEKVTRSDLVQFKNSEGEINFENISREEDLGFLLLAGAPLNESIARMGPFVMNTKQELEQAYNDYMYGRIGAIQRKGDKHAIQQ